MNNARGFNYASMIYQLQKAGVNIQLNYRPPKWGEDRSEIVSIEGESFVLPIGSQPNLDALCVPYNDGENYTRIHSLLEGLWKTTFPRNICL